VLSRIITHLKDKPAAFRVIDTHAGAGLYDLSGPEASRTGEWREGIARLLAAELAPAVRALLAPYLDVVAALNPGGQLKAYPGSPALAQALMREQDRLVACEREPNAARALGGFLHGDARAKVVEIDGYTALNAYVPPKERRGLVLIDPPYEQPDEFERLGQALAAVHRKWPTGIYALWYPIKNLRETAAFARHVIASGIPRVLRAELTLARENDRLGGSGLIVVNPPWRLEEELAALLPALAQVFGAPSRAGATRLDWLAREK
jgi:23S rRNA (adenine2030-N6)-methyltransferase